MPDKNLETLIPTDRDVLETRIFRVWVADDGIVEMCNVPNQPITKKEVLELFEKGQKWIKTWESKLILTHAFPVKSVSREARLLLAKPPLDSCFIARANAIVVRDAITQVIVNFLILVNKPPYTTKVFKSKEKARAWLSHFSKPRASHMERPETVH